MSFEINMAFTLNDIELKMTLTFDQALVNNKHVVELCKLLNFVHLTFTLIH